MAATALCLVGALSPWLRRGGATVLILRVLCCVFEVGWMVDGDCGSWGRLSRAPRTGRWGVKASISAQICPYEAGGGPGRD
jgi:hypothetical protein